jgi:hypothetical protein
MLRSQRSTIRPSPFNSHREALQRSSERTWPILLSRQHPLGRLRLAEQKSTSLLTQSELTVNLVYVSPTQINFVTPESYITASTGSSGPVLTTGRIVLIRDGVRFDARYDITGGPGYMTLDPFGYTRNPDIFGVGYECLFSFSLTDPSSCGLSWSQGPNRALLGAVTDISGNLITSQNPVRQGELITLWMTGLTGLDLDPKTGLRNKRRQALGVSGWRRAGPISRPPFPSTALTAPSQGYSKHRWRYSLENHRYTWVWIK